MTAADAIRLRDQLDQLVATIADTLDLLEPGKLPIPNREFERQASRLSIHLRRAEANARVVLIYCHQTEIQS